MNIPNILRFDNSLWKIATKLNDTTSLKIDNRDIN